MVLVISGLFVLVLGGACLARPDPAQRSSRARRPSRLDAPDVRPVLRRAGWTAVWVGGVLLVVGGALLLAG
jgi:hypothetical protein